MIRVLDIEKTAENIQYYLNENNMSQRQLAILCDVSDAAVHKWITGLALPSLTNLVVIASIFHCTLDNLVASKRLEEKM